MTTKQVGPYEVKELSVEEGLSLLNLAGKDDASFQVQLVMKSVTKNGQPINKDKFSEIVPHLKDLYEAASALNGFRNEETQ